MVKGGGDLATGVAHRLHRVGMKVVVTELAQPTVIRRAVAFASAVFEGEVAVEGVVARRVEDAARPWLSCQKGSSRRDSSRSSVIHQD